MNGTRVVMIYIEPTPYICGLIDACRALWEGPMEVFYITTDLTQQWGLAPNAGGGVVLPDRRGKALLALWQALSRMPRETVLHLSGWGHPLLVATLLIGRLLGFHVFIESDTAKGKTLGMWKTFVKYVTYPRLFQLADHFLPGGKRQAAYLVSYGVPTNKITIANMTVDVAAITQYIERNGHELRAKLRDEMGLSVNIKAILYVGRLEPYKGVADLLDAFADVQSRRNDIRLLVVGSGSLVSLVRSAAAANKDIFYLGQLSQFKVIDAYITSDIVVIPSLYEPWGLVVNEAMACGRPIVATDRVGCVDDLITHGVAGFVVPANTPQVLADALELLASDDRLREEMGVAATRMIAPWTLQNEAKILVDCWRTRCCAF